MQKSYCFKKNIYKGNNEVAADLKPIYQFPTPEEADNQLSNFARIRGMFHGFDYEDYETDAITLLPDTAVIFQVYYDFERRFFSR